MSLFGFLPSLSCGHRPLCCRKSGTHKLTRGIRQPDGIQVQSRKASAARSVAEGNLSVLAEACRKTSFLIPASASSMASALREQVGSRPPAPSSPSQLIEGKKPPETAKSGTIRRKPKPVD